MRELLIRGVALAALAVTGLTLLVLALFLGNFVLPRTIDAAAVVALGDALAVNSLLLLVFAIQHSGMARPGFKRRWRHWFGARLERSSYVLLSCLALLALMAFWQPMGGVVWSLRAAALVGLLDAAYLSGWLLMLRASCLLDLFELLGLRQAFSAEPGNVPPRLQTPGLYRHVRHPIYLGWLLILWATPVMTVTHLLLAGGLTVYLLLGILLEERDLARTLPDYRQYQRKVPMLLPSLRRHLAREPADSGVATR